MKATALFLVLAVSGCATLSRIAKAAVADPCAPMDLADVVRIIASTDVKHVAMPVVNGGVTLGTYFASRDELLLNALAAEPVRRLALIHELFHARQDATGKPNDDETVQACALTEYLRLFGTDQDLPPSMQRPKLEELK